MNGTNAVTEFQGAMAVRLPSLTIDGDGLATLPIFDDQMGYEYMASSLPVMLADVDPARLQGVEMKSPDTGSRIGQLVLRVAGEGQLLERLKKIEDYLRKTYQYSLVTENPKNLDPIENFLFEERRGHCEFFATAGALMARELGVETRVGYGWAGGKYYEINNMFVFRAREAHAWVEVKLDGYGWVVMEPTPPTAIGFSEPRVAQAGEKMPSPDEVIEEELEESYKAERDLTGMAIILTVGFGLGAAVLVFIRTRKREDAQDGSGSSPARRKDAGYFAAWRKAYARRGGKYRDGATLKNQVQSLDEAPEFSHELIRYHYMVRYEGATSDPKRERTIEREIEKWGDS